jgi:hypothetical protein
VGFCTVETIFYSIPFFQAITKRKHLNELLLGAIGQFGLYTAKGWT